MSQIIVIVFVRYEKCHADIGTIGIFSALQEVNVHWVVVYIYCTVEGEEHYLQMSECHY